jgi:hypothetical protein
MLQFETILRNYLSRNYTTTYTNNYPVWKASSSGQEQRWGNEAGNWTRPRDHW